MDKKKKKAKDGESPSRRKRKTAVIEKTNQALSTYCAWFLPENTTPEPTSQTEPHSAISIQIPSAIYPRAPRWEGPFRLPLRDPFPLSLQLSSSLFRKPSPVKWEALLISAPRPGLLFAWQSVGRGQSELMMDTWDERSRWVAALVEGGGEEDKK